MTLAAKQQEFLTSALQGNNIFLTGKAGTGKSFIIRHTKAQLAHKKVITVAPTGIAATNIDGVTIHSMFRIPPYGVYNYEECQFLKSAAKKVLKEAEIIIIDEVSMLRPDLLDAMHWTMKKNGLKGLDSKQLILVGDMKQLPVILEDNTRSVLYQTYDGDTFMFAQILKKMNIQTIELDEIQRQSDEDFINALNLVREGQKAPYFRQFIAQEIKGVVLAPHNATVQRYNEDGLKAQNGELFTFKAKITGTAKPEDFHLEGEIKVKIGCKIMYLVNSVDNPLRNGTLGVFVSHNNCHYIRVGNVDYALKTVTLTKKQYVYNSTSDALELEDIGSIEQYPFKLAYALSIHKAQGLTFEEATIDLKRQCFVPGQLYVALSRVKSPKGLRIIVK
jgi:ATP-dependent exoDNAse (exonuclease V) alpha subunit